MAAKVCAKRPLCQPPLFPPAWGVDSPAIWNSFLGGMVAHGGGRGESPLEGAFLGRLERCRAGQTLDTGTSNVLAPFLPGAGTADRQSASRSAAGVHAVI